MSQHGSNLEHLQWPHIRHFSTAARENNLYAVFGQHFTTLTYVTTRPEMLCINLLLCGVNLTCEYDVFPGHSGHRAVDKFHDIRANDGRQFTCH